MSCRFASLFLFFSPNLSAALLAIGAACSYVALSRRLAKLSELDEAAEALDPEYF